MTEAWTPETGSCTTKPTAWTQIDGSAYPYWHSWTINPDGNRKTETRRGATNTTYTYTYPAAGAARPHAVTNVTASGGTTWSRNYTYDNAGNTKTRPTSTGATQTLTFDREGKILSSTDSATTSYIYDADGNRLIRTDPTGKTLYLPGGTEVRYTNTTTIKTATRYYTHAGQTIAIRTGTGLSWIASDHHGTAELTINATTLAVAKRRMLPYGEQRGSTAGTWAAGMDKGFVGGTQDPTGLTHLGAREYDPTIGRFISVDPVMDLTDPQQWNPYTYANNSPVTFSDPSGLLWINDGGGKYVPPSPSVAPSKPAPPTKPTKPTKKSFWGKIGSGMYSGAKRAVVDPLRAAGGQIADGWTSVYNNANAVADGKMSFTDALADAGKTFVTNYVSAIVSVPMGVVGVYEGYAKTIGHIAEGDYEAAAASWTESSIGAVGIAAGARTGFKGGCRHSFAPTTAVLLADGTRRAISDVGVGDLVLATDPETGETTEKPVTDLHKNQDRELTDLTVRTEDGEFTTLHTTQHHPFWSESRRDWVDAAELQPTERLHTSTGEAVTVAKVRNFIDDQTMRDLTVADLHTYYVIAGNAPVLVHNGGGKPFSDRHGNLTDGKHTVSEAAMAPHTTGSFAGKMLPDGTAMPAGKSQFLFRVDASAEALKAARYADANKLWIGNKAKVFVSNGPIGVLGRTGELTSWMTVTRSGRTIHAWPSGAP
ncbi:hypothetical protein A6A27_40020 [Micromonospora sp. CB01531]|nr:polymorphic toxin-type HINT domain-containing protein [Micromonospora sp. CB01531]OKI85929.1 hypothetical protein A6A27_40020 [Micromonospora sp. CB01531]